MDAAASSLGGVFTLGKIQEKHYETSPTKSGHLRLRSEGRWHELKLWSRNSGVETAAWEPLSLRCEIRGGAVQPEPQGRIYGLGT